MINKKTCLKMIFIPDFMNTTHVLILFPIYIYHFDVNDGTIVLSISTEILLDLTVCQRFPLTILFPLWLGVATLYIIRLTAICMGDDTAGFPSKVMRPRVQAMGLYTLDYYPHI